MSFDMAATDEDFIHQAPRRVGLTVDVAQPAHVVWGDLVADDPMSYCRIISRIDWTSPRPFSAGTTRTVRVLGGLFVFDESYVRWEDGRRKVFVGVRSNLPLTRRFAEDYLVAPVAADRCRFTWTAVWEPTALGRPLDPVTHALFASLGPDISRHFAAC